MSIVRHHKVKIESEFTSLVVSIIIEYPTKRNG